MSARPLSLIACSLAGALAPLGAQGIHVDWTPTSQEIVLNTDSTQIQTSAGTFTVRGGVFVFRNVTIPAGVTVRGEGSNPLVFILAGSFRLAGKISVRGADGQPVHTLNSANFPTPGGFPACNGGGGGAGSPSATARSLRGERGWGPYATPGFGGGGGWINCADNRCRIASGGGGGSFATQGDPYFKLDANANFPQPRGQGAFGCISRTSTSLPGGVPGLAYFVDRDPGNNFYGLGYDVHTRRFVHGELPVLVGGSGGGGGGDYALSCSVSDPNFTRDEKGGGGGAGGGVICIAASGPIILGPQACVDASGGNGGGGAWAGSSNYGGGGGGGAGGMAILYTQTRLDITVHGETYARNDFDFPVSADGGVGRLNQYSGGGTVRTKYDPFPTEANMNARPSGGLGGLGIIQFMTPPDPSNADNTNTVLDDNIILRSNGAVLTGAEKQRFLAWRGFPDLQGVWRDDQGRPVNIGKNAGDFRPTPILLPVF